MEILGNTQQWLIDNGDNTHRVNYNLNNNSIVFDLGGYLGWFVGEINKKYGSKIYCYEPLMNFAQQIQNKYINNKNVFVFTQAISHETKKEIIYVNDNSSSMFQLNGNPVEIDCVTLDKTMNENNITTIDLIKINIEGSEYPLLDYMIKNNLHTKCKNIQVQFHKFVENYESKYNNIYGELQKTHYLTYRYPFVWENWKLK